VKEDLVSAYLRDLNDHVGETKFTNPNKVFLKLYKKELEFVKVLRKKPEGRDTYVKFIRMINTEKQDIKQARNFFRMRQGEFQRRVLKAIGKMNTSVVCKAHVNYQFCYFVMNNLETEDKIYLEKIDNIYKEIIEIRKGIASDFLRLAVYSAKRSHQLYKDSYSDFSDIIQIANEALMHAIDSYVVDTTNNSKTSTKAPNDKNNNNRFKYVAIGWILSRLMASQGSLNSAVFINEATNKKLFQIRRTIEDHPNDSMLEISIKVQMSEFEVNNLLALSDHISMDAPVKLNQSEAHPRTFGDRFASEDPSSKTYEVIESNDLSNKLQTMFKDLTVLEKKLLILKGIKI
jgi:hypothetical protein